MLVEPRETDHFRFLCGVLRGGQDEMAHRRALNLSGATGSRPHVAAARRVEIEDNACLPVRLANASCNHYRGMRWLVRICLCALVPRHDRRSAWRTPRYSGVRRQKQRGSRRARTSSTSDIGHTFATRAARGRLRCSFSPRKTTYKLKWIAATASGKKTSAGMRSRSALRPTTGPRREGPGRPKRWVVEGVGGAGRN